MIACLYGKTAEPYVTPAVADLQARGERARRARSRALTIETAVRAERAWESVERLYVLPFDVPLQLPASVADGAGAADPRALSARRAGQRAGGARAVLGQAGHGAPPARARRADAGEP